MKTREIKPEGVIPGLAELRSAIATYNCPAARASQVIESGSSVFAKRTVTTAAIAALKLRYPEAAEYLRASIYIQSGNDKKSTSGIEAEKMLMNGASAASAADVMDNWVYNNNRPSNKMRGEEEKMKYNKELVTLSKAQVQAIAQATGQIFYPGYLPVVGRYISHGRLNEGRLRVTTQYEFASEYRHLDNPTGIKIGLERYMSGDDIGKVIMLRIGTVDTGPVLSYGPGRGWCNLYSHGNYGRDYCNDGNWSANSRETYPTMREALLGRDYLVAGINVGSKYPSSKIPQEVFDKLYAIGN